MRTSDPGSALLAITSSALLLPPYSASRADAPPATAELGLNYSKYREDDINSADTFGRDSERMEVDIAQLHMFTPVGDDWSIALDVSWEDMSGASPWFVGQSINGEPKVIMSGPSIKDTRTEVSVTTRYYYDHGNAGLNYTRSREDDYDSDALAVDASLNSADGLTTYHAAISTSDDTIEPTEGATPVSTLKDEKDSHSAWVGITRIVSRRAVIRFGLSYTYRDGFLSDPYKANDQRPDTREEWIVESGYRHFSIGMNAAIQIDYRFFDDDWGVNSHTVDLAWHQNIGRQLQMIPFLRYYTQSEADFFTNVVDVREQYFADDYRLSAFGAISTGLRLRYDLADWSVNLAGERYRTDHGWGLFSGDESPALVDAWRVSFGLDYRFN